MKLHKINHSKLGNIEFCSRVEDHQVIFESASGDFLGSWDREMGGGLSPIIAGDYDFECDDPEGESIYMETEELMFNAICNDYRDFFAPSMYEPSRFIYK